MIQATNASWKGINKGIQVYLNTVFYMAHVSCCDKLKKYMARTISQIQQQPTAREKVQQILWDGEEGKF